jgi:serine/threonine protein kinase
VARPGAAYHRPVEPTQLGRYRILREIGRGAMGIVYHAEDEALQREVAVKALMLSDDPDERAEHEARFRQEAKAGAGLNHPNVVTIFDIGREGDLLYIAMELLAGVELRSIMKERAVELPVALHCAAQVASGLAAAHARGIVHRDIKPANIMVMAGHHVKIMDFGVARMQASDIKTRTGVMLGSPKYMSPEQVEGKPADHRSDIFALGSVLYEMVTGAPPFMGADLGALLWDIMRGTPIPPSQRVAGVPPALDEILAKAMAKVPGARYQEARQMAEDLERCLAFLGGSKLPPLSIPAQPTAPAQPEEDAERTLPRASTSGTNAAAPTGPAWDKTVIAPRPTEGEAAAPTGPAWDKTVIGKPGEI